MYGICWKHGLNQRARMRPDTALLTDAFHSALRASHGAARRER
jgi:hypothetical protein